MASEQKKRFPLVLVLLPLVAMLGIAAVVGANLYREYARSEVEDDEAKKLIAMEEAEKAKAPHPPREPPPKVEAPVEPEEDLGNLPKGMHKKPAGKPSAPSNQTPAQKSFFAFKAAYDKLEAANENAARKFRARKLQLEDQLGNGTPANEAKFVGDCDATRAQILEALRNPENQ
jgi:hypothetical protein